MVPSSSPTEDARSLESLIVLSDVHLGSDLDDAPGAPRLSSRTSEVDADLAALLDHYALEPPPSGTWRLVVDGDLFDFLRARVHGRPGDDAFGTPLTEEERAHGLGGAAPHAVAKLDALVDRHPAVFSALRRFLDAGHAVTIIRGNHDVDLHWQAVQDRARERISGGDPTLGARVAFSPWFVYAEGLAFIEHGQQYDDLCAANNLLAPLSPIDTDRTEPGLCDVLNRFVVRPSKGLWEYGHEGRGGLGFLWYAAGIGIVEATRVGLRSLRALRALFQLRAARRGPNGAEARRIHEARVRGLAEANAWAEPRLAALLGLHVEPATNSALGIASCMLFDRVALALALGPTSLLCTFFGFWSFKFMIVGLVGIAAWVFGHRELTRIRRRNMAETLEARAADVAAITEVRYVVMGHTHGPRVVPLPRGEATYVNLGSWSEEALADGRPLERATRTHLVVDASTRTAELREWLPASERARAGAPYRAFVTSSP
ncbi:MAG: hypothetical protein U0414_20475 [Polyangiaceae bacterium]